VSAPVRYRFGAFVLSPRGRTLLCEGRPVPLIPRYFDLLHLLVVRRGDAVSKAEIFAAVWSDVIVSDGALAQAVRTLRRALDDDPRAPRFIRTVSRHGYQFIAADVVEERDGPDNPGPRGAIAATPESGRNGIADLVDRLLVAAANGAAADHEAREAAAQLLAVGRDTAVDELRGRPGHARALAYLRDARWDAAAGVAVPLAGDAELAQTALALVRIRLRDGAALIGSRGRGAALLGMVTGAAAGAIGGLALITAPAATATPLSAVALAVLGAAAGAAGVTAVTLGVAAAEVVARSARATAVIAAAALSGGLAGGVAHVVARALVQGLLGVDDVPIAGPFDGALLATAVVFGYAIATRSTSGGALPAPRGRRRSAVIAATVLGGALAGAALGSLDRPMVGGLINQIARHAGDAPLALGPLGRFLGEATFGPVTRLFLAAFEGAAFGLGVGASLTRRPPSA
jgi:DNA-binding winged helix-turn-helix (wHTH) protein